MLGSTRFSYSGKISKLFTLFGRCHRGYAMKVFTADDIERLGKKISAIPTMTSIS